MAATSSGLIFRSDLNNSVTDDISCFRYHMGHRSRGRLIIIANSNFKPESGITEKRSTSDAFRLSMDFEKLGFCVVFYANLPTSYMLQHMTSGKQKVLN